MSCVCYTSCSFILFGKQVSMPINKYTATHNIHPVARLCWTVGLGRSSRATRQLNNPGGRSAWGGVRGQRGNSTTPADGRPGEGVRGQRGNSPTPATDRSSELRQLVVEFACGGGGHESAARNAATQQRQRQINKREQPRPSTQPVTAGFSLAWIN